MIQGLTSFLKAKEIKQITKKLADEIAKDYADVAELIFVCPLKGSLFFLSDLVRQIPLPSQVDFVLLESKGEESFKIKKDISLNLKGKHVLIVEEIIDSGLALSFLKERLRLAYPADLKTVVLLDKMARRKTFTRPDYIGKSIDDRFIVGYGMDLNEEGRNYPDMHYLAQ